MEFLLFSYSTVLFEHIITTPKWVSLPLKKKKKQADVSHGWYPASFKLSDIARVFKTFCLNYNNYVSNNKNERTVTVAWKYSIFNIIYNWAEIVCFVADNYWQMQN